MLKTTLEQWRMLQAVVEHGGFAQAAEAIHKSQSTINHAVHKLQDQLGLQLLEVVGRKAQLTEAGRLMLRRSGQLLDQAGELEAIATSLAEGNEAELRLAVDEIYPPDMLARALAEFSQAFPNTRVELYETVLSGGPELLARSMVDLMVAGSVPAGHVGQPVMRAEFIAVVSPNHPLLGLDRELNLQDLQRHRQVVLRDSALEASKDSGWLGAEQRWTVSHVSTSVDTVLRGLAFAWLPAARVTQPLQEGRLVELPLGAASRRYGELYLAFADQDRAGPATAHMAGLLCAYVDTDTE